jgi:chromosome segregation ATPase
MSQNYNRKLEAQDETIRTLNQRVDHGESMRNSDYEAMLQRENEALKSECQVLREKVSNLGHELQDVSRGPGAGEVSGALEQENRRLRNDLVDKERECTRQLDQMRSLMTEKDHVLTK